MKAIVTTARPDGTYDEVGMLYRRVTGEYKTLRTLLKYGVGQVRVGTRVEVYYGSILSDKPNQTLFLEPS